MITLVLNHLLALCVCIRHTPQGLQDDQMDLIPCSAEKQQLLLNADGHYITLVTSVPAHHPVTEFNLLWHTAMNSELLLLWLGITPALTIESHSAEGVFGVNILERKYCKAYEEQNNFFLVIRTVKSSMHSRAISTNQILFPVLTLFEYGVTISLSTFCPHTFRQ